MTNKKIYIEEQLEFAKMNRLLLTEEPNRIVKELLEESSIYDVVALIDSYISMLENVYFIRYFDSVRENLISTIQILIFCLFRYSNCTNQNEYPFLYEEELETLMQNLESLKNMNLPIEDKYEKEEEYRDKKGEYDYQKEESK